MKTISHFSFNKLRTPRHILYQNSFNKEKFEPNLTISNSTSTYYKDPFFYNNDNLNKQLSLLKLISYSPVSKLSKFSIIKPQINGQKYTTLISNASTNFNNTSSTNNISNSKSSYENSKNKSLPSLKLQYIPKVKSFEETNLYQMSTFFSQSTLTNSDVLNSKYNSEYEKKVKPFETDDFYYKKVFKMKPLFRRKPRTIDNKLNIKYAESNAQYEKMLEKENKQLILEGKKPINKLPSKYVDIKLDEIKRKIRFMKGVVDFSFPGFVVTKIKAVDKILKEELEKNWKNYHTPAQERDIGVRNADLKRRKYLMESVRVENEKM